MYENIYIYNYSLYIVSLYTNHNGRVTIPRCKTYTEMLSRRQTADSREQTADSRQQTADSRPPFDISEVVLTARDIEISR